MIIKKILFLIIIANIGLVKAQYTAIPDPCFEIFLLEEGLDSEGFSDGQILTSDIENITELSVFPNFCSVTDLTGIQDFAALEILECSFNNLTEIDISQNLNLKELHCNSNKLISLDISNNIELTYLACAINQIETFISGNNINLEYIQLGNNNLTNLNTSNFTNLKTFFCIINNFSQIDLSQNLNLEEIGIKLNPQLNLLDIRNNNNNLITFFDTIDTPNLTCIFVDDATYSTENWLDIDSNSTFVETETECASIDIDEFLLSNIIIYPNPIKDFLHIENESLLEITEIKGYTLLGKEIISTNENVINVSKIDKGLFILKIKFHNGKEIMKKIIKI